MSGKVIGKSFDIGYAGTVSKSADAIISQKAVSVQSKEIIYGQAVVLEEDNTIRSVKEGDTEDRVLGVAVREVRQTTDYVSSAGSYLPESAADILERGTIAVKCNRGTPKAGGKVYIRTAKNEAVANGVVGEFEAEADEETVDSQKVLRTIEMTNAVFATGKTDGNGIAEIKILSRNL